MSETDRIEVCYGCIHKSICADDHLLEGDCKWCPGCFAKSPARAAHVPSCPISRPPNPVVAQQFKATVEAVAVERGKEESLLLPLVSDAWNKLIDSALALARGREAEIVVKSIQHCNLVHECLSKIYAAALHADRR